jgi:hypothetical protein
MGLKFKGVGNRQPLQNAIVIILYCIQFYMARPFFLKVVFKEIFEHIRIYLNIFEVFSRNI